MGVERDERASLWGARRRAPATERPDAAHVDDHASPKEQHVLDLQRSAGNAAVTDALVQRSLWGDVEEWFGGGGSDSTLKANDTPGGIKGGGAQPVIFESPGSIKGGGASPGSIKGGGMSPVLDGPAEASSAGMQGAKGFGDLEEKGALEQKSGSDEQAMGEKGFGEYDEKGALEQKGSGGAYDEKGALEQKGGSDEQPMGEKGFGEYDEKGALEQKDSGAAYEEKALYEEKGGGYGFDEELPSSEKGFGDYEQKGDTGAYDGGEQTDAEKGYADREEKGGYEGWGDEYGPAPAGDEQEAKGGEVHIN